MEKIIYNEERRIEWINNNKYILFQVTNHFTDFETDPEMMECLEKFEDILEKESSSSQQMLRMLLFASQTKVD